MTDHGHDVGKSLSMGDRAIDDDVVLVPNGRRSFRDQVRKSDGEAGLGIEIPANADFGQVHRVLDLTTLFGAFILLVAAAEVAIGELIPPTGIHFPAGSD
jgi:hypothetical protein